MKLYKIFKNGFSVTIILQLFGFFTLLIYLLFFLFFGGINLFGTEMNILLVLIALGVSCLVTLLGIGVFMRVRAKFLKRVGTEDEFPIKTFAEKIVLTVWIAAIFFFGSAVFYGFYLIYHFQVFPIYGRAIGLIILLIIIALIITCAILQLFLLIMAKFTKKIVRQILPDQK